MKSLRWKGTVERTKQVISARVRYKDKTKQIGGYSKHIATVYESITGEVEVTIDLDTIASELARKALRNRSQRATTSGGRIKAKVLAARIIAERRVDQKLPAYLELVPEEEVS